MAEKWNISRSFLISLALLSKVAGYIHHQPLELFHLLYWYFWPVFLFFVFFLFEDLFYVI